jgi:hypothetical protein
MVTAHSVVGGPNPSMQQGLHVALGSAEMVR